MTTKLTIESEIQKVASEQNVRLAPLSDDLNLLDSGLDSLCFAILVARLEDEFGVDPFSTAAEAGFPTTFGELVKFYENAVA